MYAIINSFVADNINTKNKENTIFELYIGNPLKQNVFSISLNKENFVSKLKKTDTEIFESIDQSRIVENKLSLKGIYLKNSFPGINTKQEEKQVIDILKNNKIQKNILKQVLNYC